jgi:hypothetical protein
MNQTLLVVELDITSLASAEPHSAPATRSSRPAATHVDAAEPLERGLRRHP